MTVYSSILTDIYLIEFLTALVAAFPVFRYCLHMFQQNGYKPGEQKKWLRENSSRFRLTKAIFFLGLVQVICSLALLFGGLYGTVAFALVTFFFALAQAGLSYAVYQAAAYSEKYASKKPLVFTDRVKRLIAMLTGLMAAIGIWAVLFARTWLYEIILRDITGAAAPTVLRLLAATGFPVAEAAGPVSGSLAFGFLVFVLDLMLALAGRLILLANLCASPIEKGINNNFIKDAKRILAAHRAAGMQVIGVTGSYGKTSVKFFLRDMLAVKYSVCATPSSFNTPMGLVRTIREHMKNSDRIFIAEMGARNVGDIKELTDLVEPDWGVITAVGPQHLATFGSIENIKKTKFELADAVAAKGGKLFINGDNDEILDEISRHANRDVVIYTTRTEDELHALRVDPANGTNAAAPAPGSTAVGSAIDSTGGTSRSVRFYRASAITSGRHGTSFTVTAPDGTACTYDMGLVGSYNVINVLGAIAVAAEEGIALADLRIPVRRLTPVEHRMQLRPAGPNATIIDDAYNSNPVGSKAAVETLGTFSDGLKIMITPGMVELGDRQAEYNKVFGGYAALAGIDYILLVKGASGLGRANCDAIAAGAAEKGFPEDHIKLFDSFTDAYGYAMTGIRTDAHRYVLLENDLTDNY